MKSFTFDFRLNTSTDSSYRWHKINEKAYAKNSLYKKMHISIVGTHN
jgi:hypothetical protein